MPESKTTTRKAPADASAPSPPTRQSGRRSRRKRHLVIVESPAKADTIARFLGDDYRVAACYGHVRDLPSSAEERPEAIRGEKWGDLAVNVEKDFEPVYIVPSDKRKHIERLRKELQSADRLLLATDEDREGESIVWHLLELLQPKVPVERIVFHEVTEEAISQALESPRDVDTDLVQAQESRRILDRLFGYSLSPVLWRKVRAGLSAGRVQSVAVRLLVQRERERIAFHDAVYWDLRALLEVRDGRAPATLRRLGDQRLPTGRDFDAASGALKTRDVRVLDEAQAAALIAPLQAAAPWQVTAVEASPLTSRPAPPFTTSTLQQEASRKLGFGANRTMRVAQSLYEGIDIGVEREGLITYMRTDSVTLARQALDESQEVIRERFGADFAAGPRGYRTKTRNAQEAHEAIRPTHLRRAPESLRAALSFDQLRLYELIWQRTLASQMPNARLERTVVTVTAALPDGPATFEARGQRVLFPGHLRVYQESTDDLDAESSTTDVILPAMQVGDAVRPTALEIKRHETQPPARYTEASLVKRLEEEGLGRPSTYAAILSTIQERGYTFKQGNALVPSFLALAVTDLLTQHFGDLVEPRFTAQMENTLDAIARGEADSTSHLRSFYLGGDGEPGLEQRIQTELPQIAFPHLQIGEDPASGDPLVIRIGRFGPYLQCGEGDARQTASLPPDLAPADLNVDKAQALLSAGQEGPRVLGHDPESGIEVLLQSGRYGPYVQLGPNPPAKAKGTDQPRRASVPRELPLDETTLEDALLWLSLPRVVGQDPAPGADVIAASGRYGPYVQLGKESRSVGPDDDIYTLDLDRALQLLAEPKGTSFRRRAQARVLQELGPHPDSNAPVRVLEGRYGPYATDGTTNASLPRGVDPASVTLDQAVALIADRAAAPKRSRGRKRAGKPRATKRSAVKRQSRAKKQTGEKRPPP